MLNNSKTDKSPTSSPLTASYSLRESTYITRYSAISQLFIDFEKATQEKDVKKQQDLQNQIRKELSIRNRGTSVLVLPKVNISGLDLSKLNLSHIDFSEGQYDNVNFNDSNLQYARFHGKDRYKRCLVKNCSFKGANCNYVDFVLADLCGSVFDQKTEVEEAQFERSRLDRGIIEFLIPKAHYLNHIDNRPKIKLKDISFEDADLKKLNFSNLYLNGCYFHGADIRGADFRNADITGANFKGIKNHAVGKTMANQKTLINNVVSIWQFVGAIGFTDFNFDDNVAKLLRLEKAQGANGSVSFMQKWIQTGVGIKRSMDDNLSNVECSGEKSLKI